MTSGGRNLAILGFVSVVVAISLTGISLALYHNSGDIYLDRSRPGYLPGEDDEPDDIIEEDYELDKSGLLTDELIKDYLRAFGNEINAVDAYKDPFNSEALSDAKLGITAE